jgi:ATP-dependent DNA helicase HFM1/MER3
MLLMNRGYGDPNQSVNLEKCLQAGIAYHHAGLDSSTRQFVEQEFAAGKLRSLCATSTLAMGVNLPA